MIVVQTGNGIGDRFCDILGASVIAEFTNQSMGFQFHNDNERCYDRTLFSFEPAADVKGDVTYINECMRSISLSPPMVCKYLGLNEVHQVYAAYARNARKFSPCKEIECSIPDGIENAYGVHLRATDMVNAKGTTENLLTQSEHMKIMNAVLSDIQQVVLREKNPVFFLCSDDAKWKQHIQGIIENFAPGKSTFLDAMSNDTRQGAQDFLDLFTLSRCKKIFMTVKYSTFSIMASLIGNVPIQTYAHVADAYEHCFIHFWLPVLRSAMTEHKMLQYSPPKRISYITSTSKGYIDFTLNLLKSVERIDPQWKFKVYTLDKESYDELREKGYHCVLKKHSTDGLIEFCKDGYREVTFMKLQCIIDELEKCDNVMFLDGDIVVLKDFRNLLMDVKNDAIFQSEDDLNQIPTKPCTGCMFVNKRVIPWFKDGIARMSEYEHDQDFIEKTIKRVNLRVAFWSPVEMCNGKVFPNIPKDAYIMHYNWCVGYEEKKRRMIATHKWFI